MIKIGNIEYDGDATPIQVFIEGNVSQEIFEFFNEKFVYSLIQSGNGNLHLEKKFDLE